MKGEDDPVAPARRSDIDPRGRGDRRRGRTGEAAAGAALGSGKHLVTANKAMLARHGRALAEAARRRGRACASRPRSRAAFRWSKALTEGLAGNAITRLMGVMNGTCNYILARMEAEDAPYEAVLEEAKRLGCAGRPIRPFDVGGIDAGPEARLARGDRLRDKGGLRRDQRRGIERVGLADTIRALPPSSRLPDPSCSRVAQRRRARSKAPDAASCTVPAEVLPIRPISARGVTNIRS